MSSEGWISVDASVELGAIARRGVGKLWRLDANHVDTRMAGEQSNSASKRGRTIQFCRSDGKRDADSCF